MFTATQYYRAPFPERKYWKDDFKAIADAGIDAVQLWCLWGWIESTPGQYRYDDYDELIDLAGQAGLKVVLSTIGEIHPFWIHSLIPDSHMLTHRGQIVHSDLRQECNVGLTPGGCTDHPQVAQRMWDWLVDIAGRYADLPHLIGWDCWNETRWCVGAMDPVCYCPHTLREFRRYLQMTHGDLESLNAAWKRRYVSWDDVQPGRYVNRPYTGMIEFLRFLTWRAAQHAKFRYDAIRSADRDGFISAHCGIPAIQSGGWDSEQPLCRGVDSDLADQLDGFGSSHFPFWEQYFDDAWMGVRLEAVRSANQGAKPTWASEYHGGAARIGPETRHSVDGPAQQRGIAHCMARGAKGVIFWCWKDEVFGRESSGFGFDGYDGLAETRFAAMKQTARVIRANNDLIDKYRPAPAKVGVLFTPDNYLLNYADDGHAEDALNGVNACAKALEHLKIPYEVVEARHPAPIEKLDVLLMPWSYIIPDATREAIVTMIQRGGRVLIEAEADCFDEMGFFRYGPDRPLSQAINVFSKGRRRMDADPTIHCQYREQWLELIGQDYVTPLEAPGAEVLALNANDEPLAVRQPVGDGAAIVVGALMGRNYNQGKCPDLQRLIELVCDEAGITRDFEIAGAGAERIYWRFGASGKSKMLWLMNGNDEEVALILSGKFGRAERVKELCTETTITMAKAGRTRECPVTIPAKSYAILTW